jgi:hypothetical protein
MKPENHTFWDPEKGRYVTIPASAVIKPPTGDAEFRRKSVMAVDAVVSAIVSGIAKGLLWIFAFVILCVIGINWNIYRHEHEFDRSLLYRPLTSEQRDAEIRRQNDIALARLHTRAKGSP